jgi:hypothetical protein
MTTVERIVECSDLFDPDPLPDILKGKLQGISLAHLCRKFGLYPEVVRVDNF